MADPQLRGDEIQDRVAEQAIHRSCDPAVSRWRQMNVEDPVSKYYPASPPARNGMTVQHLLTHTSGFPKNEWENFFKGRCTPYTTDEQVKTLRDLGLPARWLMEIQEHGVLSARVHHREAFWRVVRLVSKEYYTT